MVCEQALKARLEMFIAWKPINHHPTDRKAAVSFCNS